MKKESKIKSKKTTKKNIPLKNYLGGDFDLNNKYYDKMDSFEVYKTENKITKIFGLKNKDSKKCPEPYIEAKTRYKSPFGWKYLRGIGLYLPSHVSRFIRGLSFMAKKIGWRIKQTENIEKLKFQLRESEETIINLETTNKEIREKHEKLMVSFRGKQQQILQSRVSEFGKDVKDLEKLIREAQIKKVPEQNLQQFLFDHPWLFGTEYINAEPQKFRGAHSRFDFYLERFNKTNDIVEIKLISDQIINKDWGLSAKTSQAVDQLIDYMESSQAAAHSKIISEEEGMHELRPRGIVIIGSDSSKEAKEKLHKWNYQLAHITILTYYDVLKRAKSVLEHLKKK